MIFWYFIAMIFGILSLITNSIGMWAAGMIVAGVALITEKW